MPTSVIEHHILDSSSFHIYIYIYIIFFKFIIYKFIKKINLEFF